MARTYHLLGEWGLAKFNRGASVTGWETSRDQSLPAPLPSL